MNLQLSNAFWHIYFHFNQWLYKTNRKVCKYGIIQKRKVQGIIRSSNGPFSKSLDFACRRMKWGLCIENTPFYLRYFKALNSLYCLQSWKKVLVIGLFQYQISTFHIGPEHIDWLLPKNTQSFNNIHFQINICENEHF